jgi:hypothetical protein
MLSEIEMFIQIAIFDPGTTETYIKFKFFTFKSKQHVYL